MRLIYRLTTVVLTITAWTTSTLSAQQPNTPPDPPDLVSSMRLPDVFTSFNHQVMRTSLLYVVRISNINAPPATDAGFKTLDLDCLAALAGQKAVQKITVEYRTSSAEDPYDVTFPSARAVASENIVKGQLFLCAYAELAPLEKRRALAQHHGNLTGLAYGLLPIASADDPLIEAYRTIIAIRNAPALETRRNLIDQALKNSRSDPLTDYCFLEASQSAGTPNEDWALDTFDRWIPKAVRQEPGAEPKPGDPAYRCLEQIAASSTSPKNRTRAWTLLTTWMTLDDGICTGEIPHLASLIETTRVSSHELLSDTQRQALLHSISTNRRVPFVEKDKQAQCVAWLAADPKQP